MAKKNLVTVINAPPFGGKSRLIKNLESFKVTCVDMSTLITKKAIADKEFARFSQSLMVQGKLLPCDIVLDIFHDHFEKIDHGKCIVCGIPRTLDQAESIANHPIFSRFSRPMIIDVSIQESILRHRFEERKKKENRPDDTLDNFQDRIQQFANNRNPILNAFNRHPEWYVNCVDGNHCDATDNMTKELIRSMRLEPLELTTFN